MTNFEFARRQTRQALCHSQLLLGLQCQLLSHQHGFLDGIAVSDVTRFEEAMLADLRANKVGVDNFLSLNDRLPPGVSFSVAYVANVRRPSDKG